MQIWWWVFRNDGCLLALVSNLILVSGRGIEVVQSSPILHCNNGKEAVCSIANLEMRAAGIAVFQVFDVV